MKYTHTLWVSCTGSYWFIHSIDHDCGCFLLSIPTSIHETIRLAVVPKRSLTRRSLLTDRQSVVTLPLFPDSPDDIHRNSLVSVGDIHIFALCRTRYVPI